MKGTSAAAENLEAAMRTYAITATACESTLSDFSFLPRPVDLHFLMPASDWLEARGLVALYLLDEGIVPDRLVRTREP